MQMVCLAKSKKYGGRCLAGVQVEPTGQGGHRVVRRRGEPRWVRPITATEHGEVPESFVRNVNLLDIVELGETEEDRRSFQTENIRFKSTACTKVRELPGTSHVLNQFVTSRPGPLFGNHGKAVKDEKAELLDHSLLLIRVNDGAFLRHQEIGEKPKLRAHFAHEGRSYDLPVTDPEFERQLLHGGLVGSKFDCYLTLSLGVSYQRWHYKLVAGVFVV